MFFIITTISMFAMVWFGVNSHIDFGFNRNIGVEFLTARVVEVVTDETFFNPEAGRHIGRQELRVELLAGARRGEVVSASNQLFLQHGVFAQPGTRLVLWFEQHDGDEYFARVHDHERAPTIYVIVILFFGLLAAVFGKAGLRSAFGLIFTFVVIMFLLIPLITFGWPPALLTVGLSFVIVTVTLIAIMGFEKKTYVSLAGTVIGIAFYCLFYLMISAALHVTGFNVPEMSTLLVFGAGTDMGVGIREFLFCGILIASLGAIMDVSVSLASVTAEISETNPNSGFKKLFASGMKIGRDLIGSSANTLILAFTGTFFITLIMFRINNFPYHMVVHQSDIAIEVLRSVSASAAMVLCAPATSIIASYVYAGKEKGKK